MVDTHLYPFGMSAYLAYLFNVIIFIFRFLVAPSCPTPTWFVSIKHLHLVYCTLNSLNVQAYYACYVYFFIFIPTYISHIHCRFSRRHKQNSNLKYKLGARKRAECCYCCARSNWCVNLILKLYFSFESPQFVEW